MLAFHNRLHILLLLLWWLWCYCILCVKLIVGFELVERKSEKTIKFRHFFWKIIFQYYTKIWYVYVYNRISIFNMETNAKYILINNVGYTGIHICMYGQIFSTMCKSTSACWRYSSAFLCLRQSHYFWLMQLRKHSVFATRYIRLGKNSIKI